VAREKAQAVKKNALLEIIETNRIVGQYLWVGLVEGLAGSKEGRVL
jgi:hypothetical protein